MLKVMSNSPPKFSFDQNYKLKTTVMKAPSKLKPVLKTDKNVKRNFTTNALVSSIFVPVIS